MTDEAKANEEKQARKRTKHRPRAYGTGSVFQRKDRKGKQWVAQINLENGKTKQRYYHTQGEAAEALNEMLYEQRRGTLITQKDQTVKQLVEHWLENVHKRTIRESTYVQYRKVIKNHLYPELGFIKLRQLTIQQVEAFYTRVERDEGLSASTIRQIHAILHQSLSYAVKNNLLARNVSDYISLPRMARHQVHTMTVEQARQFITAAKGHRLEALFTTAILTGMREGELLALHWSDINFEQKYLQVRCTIVRLPGRGLVESEPKTPSSNRKIVLSSLLIDLLKQQRIRQLELRLQAGKAWEEHDLVFSVATGGHLHPATLLGSFRALLRNIGFQRMNFHDLRHSAATLLLAMGVHAKVVQELLGHSTITMTLNIYSHVLPSLQEDAMDRLSDLFGDQDGVNENHLEQK